MDLYSISLFVKPRIHLHINMEKDTYTSFLPMSCFLGKFCDDCKEFESLESRISHKEQV